ncbi:MAG: hypothetical protein WCO79_02560 [bacterium]
MTHRATPNSPSCQKAKVFTTLTRPGLVVDIGPDGEIAPRWMQVSRFIPVSRGNPRGPMVSLGLAAN